MKNIFLCAVGFLTAFLLLLVACVHKDIPAPLDPKKDTLSIVITQTKIDTNYVTQNDTIRLSFTNTITSTITNHDTTRTTRRLLTLRQTSSNDGDANVHEILSTANGSTSGYVCAANWTRFGAPATYRFFMMYDLAQINATEKIISSKLYLYTRTIGATDEAFPDVTQTLNNDLQICLVKGSLAISSVTWNTQPVFSTITGENLVFSGSNLGNTLMTYDITTLVQQIAGKNKKYDNHGFAFKMAKEHDTYTTFSPYQYEAMTFHSMNSSESYYVPYIELLLESAQ